MNDDARDMTERGAAAPLAPRPARRKRPEVRIEALRDDARLRLWRHRGTSNRLVVCFSGVGRERRKPPVLEFAKTATGNGRDHVLYVADPQRSWLNAPGLLEEIVGTVQEEIRQSGAAEVVAMGHSMGGFSAMVLGGFVPLKVVLALSPQLSIHPEVAPDEQRWAMFRKHIEAYRVRSVDDHLAEATTYYILFGKHRNDAPQRRLMRPAPNVHCFVMPKVRHDSATRLHEEEVLDDVVQAAFDGRTRRLRQILKAGMNARQLPGSEAVA